MCGIIAAFTRCRAINPQSIEKSLLQLHHRGPDSNDYYINKTKRVALGHTRLSIIGLDNGTQPLHSSENNIYAVVNGEFYDYQSIKKKYTQQGYNFKTKTDSEIIIPLYLEYGTNLFKKINGEFSFIIWDEKKNLVFSARDRFGIKPLYYYYGNDDLYISSEIKALIPFGINIDWDISSLVSIFKGVPNQASSCFQNIKQIRPGHYMLYENNSLREYEYWDFQYTKSSNSLIGDFKDEQQYLNTFRSKLITSIKRRLVSDTPVGLYLSGGIDSSAILALSKNLTDNITAFNISFRDSICDENMYAQEIAKHLNINLESITITDQDIADNFSKTVFFTESPIFQTNGIAKFLLSKFVQYKGYKAVLTGEGADELLFGYPSFKEDLAYYLSAEGDNSVLNQLKSNDKNLAQGNYNIEDFQKIIGKLKFIPSIWKLGYDIGKAVESIYSDTFKDLVSHINPMEIMLSSINSKKLFNNNPVHVSAYIFLKTLFPGLVLSYLGDRVEMAHSIEGRVPFLDVDLVTYISKIPLHMKIKGIKEKYILYESIKDLIPEMIYKRTKHPISTPSVLNKANSALLALMRDVFHSQDFKSLPFFSQTKTLSLLNNLQKVPIEKRMMYESALYFAASTYFLQQQFINKTNIVH